MRAMFQLLRNIASLREESSGKEPWELTDDPAKYMWRLDDVKNIDTWVKPRNANGVKVNGGPEPPLGSV